MPGLARKKRYSSVKAPDRSLASLRASQPVCKFLGFGLMAFHCFTSSGWGCRLCDLESEDVFVGPVPFSFWGRRKQQSVGI